MTTTDDYMFPKVGHFLLRPKGDKTMMIGILEGDDHTKNETEDEIWIMQFIITDVKKFKAPKSLGSLRADQVLVMGIDPKGLEEL